LYLALPVFPLLVVSLVLAVVPSPVVLAYLYFRVRTSDRLRARLVQPEPTAWDFAFSQWGGDGAEEGFFVRMRLKEEGRVVAGYYSGESFMWTYFRLSSVVEQGAGNARWLRDCRGSHPARLFARAFRWETGAEGSGPLLGA
jgi:hypothetical protein